MLPFARNDYCRYVSYEELFSDKGKQVVMNSTMKYRKGEEHNLIISAYNGKTIKQKIAPKKNLKYTYKKKLLDNEDNFLKSLNQLKFALNDFGNNGVRNKYKNDSTLKNKDKKTRKLMITLKKVLAQWKKYNKQIDWNKKDINTDEYMNYKRKLVLLNNQIMKINKNVNLLWHKGLLN